MRLQRASEGTSNRTWKGACCQAQVQVWFRLQLKYNSLELDSEVGRLVILINKPESSEDNTLLKIKEIKVEY